MSSSAPSPPPAPDPVATAKAQSEYNVDAARQQANMNRVNQVTPQGSMTYSQDDRGQQWVDQQLASERAAYKPSSIWDNAGFDEGAARTRLQAANPYQDQWTATTTLSPEQQRLYDMSTQGQEIYGRAALSQLGQVEGTLSQPFRYDVQDRTGQLKYGPDYTGLGDPNQSRDAVQEALLARINPDLERERAALESRLANQGITMGSEAWNTGMLDQSRAANDARYGAILNAGQEQSRMFGLGMQQAGFNNSTVGQAAGMDQSLLQQLLALRAQPINEASALLTGGQVQMPQFTNVPQVGVQAPDYASAVGQNYAGAVGQNNAATARAGANNQAQASAATAAATIAIAI
jgi:hypothetical protein